MKVLVLFFILFPLSSFSQSSKVTDYNEPHRPQFHFTPKTMWMNDPNGLVFYNGKYHLFYQYYPNDIVWGPMHWGHASSENLFNWQHHPIALFPDSLGNIFSGCAVIDQNNTAGFGERAMIAIFTYHNDSLWAKGYRNTESQAIAYSLDEGQTWTKYSGNPVIANSSEKDFRDPNVFWYEGTSEWIMVLASGDRVKLFSSTNLKEWKYKSDFKPEIDLEKTGTWECVDLFKMKVESDEKWVMIVNHDKYSPNGGSGTRYFIGDFDGEKFKPTQPSIWLDYGTDFYAGVTFYNVPNDKRILISWMSNWLYATKTPTKVWRSAMTLPRELVMENDSDQYFIRQQIAGDYNKNQVEIIKSKQPKLPLVENNLNLSQAEITFDFIGNQFDVTLSNSLNESLQLKCRENEFSIDRSKSGITDFSENFASKPQIMPLNDKITTVQLILDRASIEVLLNNGKYSMTVIFFPNKSFSSFQIVADPNAFIKNLEINQVNRSW